MSKYQKLPNHKGIKKDLNNGRYLAVKYINGKEYSKKFDTLKKALTWRSNFHPSVAEEVIENKVNENFLLRTAIQKTKVRLNGEDNGYYFRNVWKLYQENYLPSLEKSSREHRLAKEPFLYPLMDIKMIEVTATLLDRFMKKHKAEAIRLKSKRCSFNDDLKVLKSILNWYRNNYDSFFINPVLPRHKHAGLIKKPKEKDKKMKPKELISFFSELDSFWRDFAEMQFYMAGRVGETAGLQASSVDFDEEQVMVKHTVVWGYSDKKFDYLKEYPKNGEVSYVSMNRKIREIMQRRVPEAVNGFIFHANDEPLSYRKIQYAYNKALEKAGLYGKYTSTHIMRHSMGTITRRVTGSLDMAQAVTRHKDIQVAEQYADMPTEANKKAVNDVFDYLDDLENSESKKGIHLDDLENSESKKGIHLVDSRS
jgi:site-specific recombinase XerD